MLFQKNPVSHRIFFIVSAHANHEVIAMQFKNLQKLIQTSSSSRQYLLSLPVSIQMQLHEQNDFIHTPQISSKTKLFCLGILRCGISVIQFALYYTRPPIPRYQFVITLITNRATCGDNVFLVVCSLVGIIAQIGMIVK